jgi:hypothetical protein
VKYTPVQRDALVGSWKDLPSGIAALSLADMSLRNLLIVGAVVVGTSAALYPIVFAPLMDNGSDYGTPPYGATTLVVLVVCSLCLSTYLASRQEEFLKQQGLTKQDIQPTGMRRGLRHCTLLLTVVSGLPVWSDPFAKK